MVPSLYSKGRPLVAQTVKNMSAIQRSRCDHGLGRSSGKGNPLQYSCLENLIDTGAWQATAPGVTKSWTQLSN